MYADSLRNFDETSAFQELVARAANHWFPLGTVVCWSEERNGNCPCVGNKEDCDVELAYSGGSAKRPPKR